MSTSRRTFLTRWAGAGGAVVLGLAPVRRLGAAPPEPLTSSAGIAPAPRPLRLLILGGTGFIGPAQIRYALGRGHTITTFNRGKTRPGLFKGRVEELLGDRNGPLDALKGRRDWDVVIDNPTTHPIWVWSVGEILKERTGHYVFISTISVYAHHDTPGQDETAPLVAMPDGVDAWSVPPTEAQRYYGPLKALSEKEAGRWFPGRTTIIRPGLIVGPDDPTDRFTYWPVRVDRGGEMLAPGDPTDPVQFIDARDLAEWTVRMVERGGPGTYNATGPRAPLTMAEMLHGLQSITTAVSRFTWVAAGFLSARRIRPGSDMPVWMPPGPGYRGFHRRKPDRALAKGLTLRPLVVTGRETLDWHRTRPPNEQANLRAGLPPAREAEVLAAWKASQGR